MFQEMWDEGIEISTKDTCDKFIEEIKKKLWIFSCPKPYSIYIRVLYELFSSDDGTETATPYTITRGAYSDYKYQVDAVKYGLSCINKNNGVIIADVVGLGKSIIASALAYNLNFSRTVIITPPGLMDMWDSYQQDFALRGVRIFSSGKIKEAYDLFADSDEPILYIIDEAHRYRNELTEDYKMLHRMTRSNPGNKVILLTATPYNNKPQDLYALVKLFQTPSKSTLNTVSNLGAKFRELIARYKKLEKRWKNNKESIELKIELDKLSKELRDLISPVIIRRSRIDLKEINEYAQDLELQNIRLPEVIGPELVNYDLSGIRDLYVKTLQNITANFKGARYNPIEYIADKTAFMNSKYGQIFGRLEIIIQAQRNISAYIRRLLVRRFESSRGAFRVTLENLMTVYENIIKWWERGYVPIQKEGYIDDPDDIDLEDLVESIDSIKDDEYADIEKLKKRAIPIERSFFKEKYINDVKKELGVLQHIYDDWFRTDDERCDPKYGEVCKKLNELLENEPGRKIVMFSEFEDTASSVCAKLVEDGFRCVLYTGSSTKTDHIRVRNNFDASVPEDSQKDDYDIVVATDALSEGCNLNRAGVVINYDIPYNPTRVVQRIGRINRINKKMFDKLYIYNFFPTDIGEKNTQIKGISTLKMLLINNIIGSDTKTLTEDEDLQSYFRREYEDAERESEDRSWDVEYRNVYNSVKNDAELMKEALAIPERVKIVRKNCEEEITVAYAKRGESGMFVVSNELGKTEIVSPETALPLFKAEPDDESYPFDEKLNGTFAAIKDKVYEAHKEPKTEPQSNRAKAKDTLDKLIVCCPAEKDYLKDLRDVIVKYDDFCDAELKFLAGLDVRESNAAQLCREIKKEIPIHYVSQIRKKAENVDNKYEIIMFTEGMRND